MYEYEVKLKKEIAVVYAVEWKKEDNGNGQVVFNFYQHGKIVKQFSNDEVSTVQKVWPEAGEIFHND
jgi:hypothetical protein